MPVLSATGQVQYKNGATVLGPNATCQNSKACLKMQNYAAVPKFMREAMGYLGWTRNVGELKGVYGH